MTRQCMDYSKPPFELIVMYQLWIYLPCTSMIVPDQIKDPDITLICYQIPFMFPTKNMLVLLPQLLTTHNLFFLIMMLLKQTITWQETNMTLTNLKIGYCTRRHQGVLCYKNIGSIDPRVLLIRWFITFMKLVERINRRGFTSPNTNIKHPLIRLIYVFSSITSTH